MRIVHDIPRVRFWMLSRMGEFGVSRLNAVEAVNGLERADGTLVSGVSYNGYNGASICMHQVCEFLTPQFLFYCFWYPFVELGCNKVIGVVPSNNPRALNFDLHLGFREEARLRDTHPEGDLVILTMRREDCRFLARRYHGRRQGKLTTTCT